MTKMQSHTYRQQILQQLVRLTVADGVEFPSRPPDNKRFHLHRSRNGASASIAFIPP